VTGGARPEGAAVSPDGESIYVADAGNGTVSQYDVGSGGALKAKSPPTIAAGVFAGAVTVSGDGKNVYVTNRGDSTVSQYDVGSRGLLKLKSPATVVTGTSPAGVASSP